MPIPAGGYPLTAAVSPRVEVVETTDSTNADVLQRVAGDPAGWPHLALRLTTDQRHGRGRLDRSWTAPAGTALAVSVVVRVPEVPAASRGWIPLAAGAALTRAVADQLRGTAHAVGLKWPNDVLVDGGKISGILAEVVPQHPDTVVVGAGVNTRMSPGDLPVSTATSFAAIGAECDDDRLLADFLRALDASLSALSAAGGDAVASGVHAEVSALCTTLGSVVRVSLGDGAAISGTAVRIDPDGGLVVDEGAVEVVLSAGDVVHVR